MSLEKAKAYLEQRGFGDRVIVPEQSSATVAEAAAALGCEPGMIAKTLSFLQGDRAVLILVEGTARIDNPKYKARFGCKARMIPAEMVEGLVGHAVGGVCPFGANPDVAVYLDESLKRHAVDVRPIPLHVPVDVMHLDGRERAEAKAARIFRMKGGNDVGPHQHASASLDEKVVVEGEFVWQVE